MQHLSIRLVHEDGRTVEIHGPADITRETTVAIVNAANSHLIGGGGVDGAIHRAGGPRILEECARIVAKQGRLPAGQAVITTGGELPAKWVIHTIGPIYRGGEHGEPELLASCYEQSLRLAHEYGIESVAFPSISTGAYGYPVAEAAQIAVGAVVAGMALSSRVQAVRFVLFDSATRDAYSRTAQHLLKAKSAQSYRIEKGVS